MSIDEIRLKYGLPSATLTSFSSKATEESIRQTSEGHKKDFRTWLSFNTAIRKNESAGLEKTKE